MMRVFVFDQHPAQPVPAALKSTQQLSQSARIPIPERQIDFDVRSKYATQNSPSTSVIQEFLTQTANQQAARLLWDEAAPHRNFPSGSCSTAIALNRPNASP